MSTLNRTVLIAICSITVVINLATATEDLYLVDKGSIAIDELVMWPGIDVYAILGSAVLIGTTPGVLPDDQKGSPSFDVVSSLGTRSISSEYYFFRMNPGDAGRLNELIDMIWYNGEEAIARIDRKEMFDHRALPLVRGLVHIPFVPRPRAVRNRVEPPVERMIDPVIQAIVDQVSQSEYTAYIQRLQDFVTRYSDTDSCRAAERWAVDTFSEMGFETELFPYNYYGNTWYNAIGRQIGSIHPDSIYLIIAHIDATSEDPYNSAPGAEDNGSGSACVLEAARILSQYEFDCTIEYVLVSGEEQGLWGSYAYAEYCYNEDRNIAGVLNFDMISYAGTHGWDTNIYSDVNFPAEVALADLLAQLTDLYTDAYSIRVNTVGPTGGSDHYYFSYYGFPAPFSIDAQFWGAPDWYPWYHSTDDVIEHLDLDFGTEVVKGGVATLATVANLSTPPLLEFVYPEGLPDVIDPDGGTTFRVEVVAGTGNPEPGTGMLHYSTGGSFTSIPMEVVSSNVYDAVFPSIECGVEVSFYVSAETDSAIVVTDPPNAPGNVYSAYSAYRVAVVYSDNFATNKGWTGLGGPGEWSLDMARGGTGDDSYGGPDPSNDHSPTSDNRLLGNDLTSSDGDYEANIGSTQWVTSPVVDCSSMIGVTLEFFRWLGVEENEYDHAYLEGNNGSSWVPIFENGGVTIDDGAWTKLSYDVSSIADGNPDFRIRFGIGRTDGGWQYCGWNVDDIEISGYSCVPIADVSVDLIPDDDPTIVPQGGSFGMTASVTNNESGSATTDVWLGAYWNNRWFQQLLFRDVQLAAGQTRQAHFYQDVPPAAPPGDYTYVEFSGDYETWSVADSSYFTVTVIEGAK
jgi:hypothetical protein